MWYLLLYRCQRMITSHLTVKENMMVAHMLLSLVKCFLVLLPLKNYLKNYGLHNYINRCTSKITCIRCIWSKRLDTTAASARSDVAKKEIIQLNTEHCNANSIQLAVGEDAQIEQAYSLGIVKTAKEVQDAARSS